MISDNNSKENDTEESYEALRNTILSEIRPTEEEKSHDKEAVSRFISELDSEISKNKISARLKVGGSYAKGTWLSGNKDIDIFMMFDYDKYGNEDISSIAEKLLSDHEIERLNGSRIYFQIGYNSLTFEIIPVLDIKDANMQKNIMDVSPLHADYVNSRLNDNMKDETRLLKKFLRAKRMYGAESHIRGFSGYICELLIARYKTLQEFLTAASSFGNEAYIDLEDYYKGIEEAKSALGKSKHSKLIVIDPVQKDRNAATALNDYNYTKLISLAKKYSEKPDAEMFEQEKVSIEKPCIHVILKGVSDKNDKSAAMMRVVHTRLVNALSEFQVKKTDWEFDERRNEWHSYIMVSRTRLDDTLQVEGPPSAMKDAADAFRKKHKDTFERDGKIFAVEKREKVLPKQIIEDMMKEDANSKRASLNSIDVIE